jgi:hypothetical protein
MNDFPSRLEAQVDAELAGVASSIDLQESDEPVLEAYESRLRSLLGAVRAVGAFVEE